MTREKGQKFSAKHGPDAQAEPIVKDTVIKNAGQGNLACAVAFKIAKEAFVDAFIAIDDKGVIGQPWL